MFQYDEKGVENMLLRIAVCDDEAIHRLIIRDKLDAYAISNDIDYELDEFTNSKELMKMENIYDILFLDVQLEDGMNGIEVGKRLLQKGIDATIIITTSFEQYASEGYHLKAHRYLIKPIQQSNFNETKHCNALGIEFHKQILYNDLSFLSYMDTCTIFANALDNAVTACSHVDIQERRIDLTLKRKKDMLSIVIENTKQNDIVEKENRLFSTKPNKEQHGFGVENIKMAVAKYNGLVSIEHTKDIESYIYQEYRREFLGEGQLFFYYKRKLYDIVGAEDKVGIEDLKAVYNLPIPTSEIDFGNIKN